MVSTQEKNNWNYMTTEQLQMWIQIYSLSFKDDSIILNVYDYGAVDYLSDRLYYTPVEIYLKQDLDTTPITITGTVSSSYPIVNTSINLLRDSQLITTFYSNLTSNDLSEVVTSLNTDPDTSHLGTYSIDNGNIVLTMQAGLKRKFVEENQLTFEVFND